MALANGGDANDSAGIGRLGFRVDSTTAPSDVTFQGDFYQGVESILARENAKVLGGNILGRWTKRTSNGSEFQIQSYFERNYRRVPLQSDFNQKTFDLDFQHELSPSGIQTLIWGAEFRWTSDQTRPTPVLSFSPRERSYPLATAFIQDELALAQGRARLTLGSKFEHNDFSGFEIQPSIRLAITVQPEQTLWAAVTRAVRTPTRFDSDIRFTPPGLVISGNPDFQSEKLIAYELGYRARLQNRFSIDIASFYNDYDDLRSLELGGAPGNVLILNNLNATSYGGEVSTNFDASDRLRFTTGYSYLGKRLTSAPGSRDVFSGTLEGNDPKHQFLIRGSADLPLNLEFDSAFRFLGSLPAPPVPRYAELDARLGWSPNPDLDLSIVGRNLLDAQHPEFGPPGPFREELERNIYGQIRFRF
jgi:iron complex outermembrane receptor protein